MLPGVAFGLLGVVVLAVIFDYINGFHDTANAIATSVATRALRPAHAILMASAFNFIGAFAGTAVAKTIAASSAPRSSPQGSAPSSSTGSTTRSWSRW
jgi:PiT family inorganic phosphate transporter